MSMELKTSDLAQPELSFVCSSQQVRLVLRSSVICFYSLHALFNGGGNVEQSSVMSWLSSSSVGKESTMQETLGLFLWVNLEKG